MGRIISFEEAKEIPKLWHNELEKYKELFNDASCNGNVILCLDNDTNPPSLRIIYREPDIFDNCIGFMLEPVEHAICAWFAVEYDGNIEQGPIICSPFDDDTSFNTIIAKCKSYINKCPICGKDVPYKEQHRYSFAGRCCTNCYETKVKNAKRF